MIGYWYTVHTMYMYMYGITIYKENNKSTEKDVYSTYVYAPCLCCILVLNFYLTMY